MNPRISVVIPTYNRCSLLVKAIDSILSGSLKIDAYEIIVSDDGSTDETEIIILKYLEKYSNIIYLKNKHSGSPAKVRNYGIKKAQGEIIAFIDDDGIADRYWLEMGLKEFENSSIAGIEGEINSDIRFTIKNSFFPVKGKRYTTINGKGWYGYYLLNMFYRKSILEKVNYLDESFIHGSCEDIDLAWRVLDFGEIKYCSDIKVFHPVKRFTSKSEKIRYCSEINTHQALLCKKHPETFKIFFEHTLSYNVFHVGYYSYFIGLIKGGIRDHSISALYKIIIPALIYILKDSIKKIMRIKNKILRILWKK
ncbi:MAG: family 2 glycosyl transferase [uncultured bacterium]|nr:MAG: family 2 glycosyl transferase [uncultured bacterium]